MQRRGGDGGGEEEARLGNPCVWKPGGAAPQALTNPRAVGLAVTAKNRLPLPTESRLGSVTCPSGPQAAGPALFSNFKTMRTAPERRLLGILKQPEPPLRAGTLFSGLFVMARAIWGPTL